MFPMKFIIPYAQSSVSGLFASGIISALIIIGSIFVTIRVKKINSHMNGKDKLPFGIKLPFYITITHYFIAVMNIIDLVNKGQTSWLCVASVYYLMPIFVNMNLVLGATIAIQTWKVVESNKISCSWYRSDFVLWIVVVVKGFIYTHSGLTHYVPGWCMVSLPLIARIADLVIIIIYLALALYSLIRIHLRLNKLDSSIQYIFHIDDIKKTRSYILIFICQWIIITFYFILRDNEIISSGTIYIIYIAAIASGGLFNITGFIKNEGLFFNPDSVVSYKQEEQLNDLEQKDIQSVKQTSYFQA